MIQPSPDALDDDAFDRLLPRYVRSKSRRYWTPASVAAQVAKIFWERGCRRVLDVGCGPGKFCIIAARLYPLLELHGVEQRPRLVRLGAGLARRFGLTNTCLASGDATAADWDAYQGFYFFNPFAENVFEDRDRFDGTADLSSLRFGRDLLRVNGLLSRARIGTTLVTYHGLGGPIPSSYEIAGEDRGLSAPIRTWVQRSERQAEWVWLEQGRVVTRVSRAEARRFLTSLVRNAVR